MSITSIALASSATAEPAPIIVTGKGLDVPIGSDAYDTVIISQERLASSASGRIETILSDAAGFQQFRRTDSRAANPTSQGATLRAVGGTAASRALVLLDGVPQADPFAGYIPYSALRPERLSSARITRGGGAGAFGAGALAGTIDLSSGGPADLPAISARAAYGSRNASELSGGITQRLRSGFVSAHAGWDRGNGYVLIPRRQRGAADIPAAYDSWSAALRAVAPMSDALELQVSSMIFDDHRLRGLAGTASRSWGSDASIRVVSTSQWGIDALAYVQDRGFRSGFVATSGNRTTTTPTLNQFNTPSTGLGAKFEIRPPKVAGIAVRIGADVRRESGQTNEFFRYVAGVPTRLRRAGGTNVTFGTYVEASAEAGPLTLTGGARLDCWSIRSGFLNESILGSGTATQNLSFANRSGTQLTARGGAIVKLSPVFDLRAAAYKGFRVPTLNELYRPFRVGADATSANADLDLERLTGFEVGADVHIGGVRIDLTGFHNRLVAAVANVTLGNGPGLFPQVGFVAAGGAFRQRLNVDAITVSGLEASVSARIDDFRLTASYAYADSRVQADGTASSLNGKRPAQTPKHQGSATISYAPKSGPNLSTTLHYFGAQFEDDLSSRRLPSALTIDAVVSMPMLSGVRIVLRVENLFDTSVVSGISATDVEDLGTPRTLWLGVTFAR